MENGGRKILSRPHRPPAASRLRARPVAGRKMGGRKQPARPAPHLRAQTTIEYVMVLAVLLVILIASYEYAQDLNLRRLGIASQIEGERMAFMVSRAMDYAAIAGARSSVLLSLAANPNQTMVVSGAEVLAIGHENRTLAASRSLANLSVGKEFFDSNQQILVSYNGTNLSVTEMG